MTNAIDKTIKLMVGLPHEAREALARTAEYLANASLGIESLTDEERAQLEQSIADADAGRVSDYASFDAELREMIQAARV